MVTEEKWRLSSDNWKYESADGGFFFVVPSERSWRQRWEGFDFVRSWLMYLFLAVSSAFEAADRSCLNRILSLGWLVRIAVRYALSRCFISVRI